MQRGLIAEHQIQVTRSSLLLCAQHLEWSSRWRWNAFSRVAFSSPHTMYEKRKRKKLGRHTVGQECYINKHSINFRDTFRDHWRPTHYSLSCMCHRVFYCRATNIAMRQHLITGDEYVFRWSSPISHKAQQCDSVYNWIATCDVFNIHSTLNSNGLDGLTPYKLDVSR